MDLKQDLATLRDEVKRLEAAVARIENFSSTTAPDEVSSLLNLLTPQEREQKLQLANQSLADAKMRLSTKEEEVVSVLKQQCVDAIAKADLNKLTSVARILGVDTGDEPSNVSPRFTNQATSLQIAMDARMEHLKNSAEKSKTSQERINPRHQVIDSTEQLKRMAGGWEERLKNF